MTTLTEADVEAAALEWLRDIGPGTPGLEGDFLADPGRTLVLRGDTLR